MFVDRVVLKLSAGKGGDGVIAWRREKYIPKGGPAGGDGGRGASIILKADPQVHSLEDYRNRHIIKAQNGQPGGGNQRTGKNGEDLVLKVPPGTLVKDVATKEVLYDLTEEGQEWKICVGGKGGKGNCRFKTSTHQAPFHCTPGLEGEAREIELELKLIADVGFVGMPNAGKSTLIKELAHISVKIAPYPFTTLKPNLGIVEFEDYSRILIADIPGIIKGAHEDKGLGLSFLKHIERTSILIYVIELAPWQERDPFEELMMLRDELNAYDPTLLEKPFLVALNKIDQEEVAPLIESFERRYPFEPSTLLQMSALQGTGTEELKMAIQKLKNQLSSSSSSSSSLSSPSNERLSSSSSSSSSNENKSLYISASI